jgi:hypothetical protein
MVWIIELPQCVTMIQPSSGEPFFWNSVYAPLTIALIVFGIVGIIVTTTCCIVWRRRRVAKSSASLQQTTQLELPNNAGQIVQHHSNKEDAFTHDVSPFQPDQPPLSNKESSTLDAP